jgi:hypothetical protein
MVDSKFWLDLAKQFDAIDCSGLQIDFEHREDGTNQNIQFYIDSYDDAHWSAKTAFNAVASTAGLAKDPRSNNPVGLWIDFLINRVVRFPQELGVTHLHTPDGEFRWRRLSIQNPCKVSMTACYELHMDALQAKQEEPIGFAPTASDTELVEKAAAIKHENEVTSHFSADGEQPVKDPARIARKFKKVGDTWDLIFDGENFSTKDTKGMAYIQFLLEYANREFKAVEISAAFARPTPLRQISVEEKAQISCVGDLGIAVSDRKALAEYKRELESIDGEMRDAANNNDLGKLERLQLDRAFLFNQLQRDSGFGGRVREFPSDAEKARKAVSRAINTALRNIAKHSLEMKEYLDDRIERGISFCYRSDGTDWDF